MTQSTQPAYMVTALQCLDAVAENPVKPPECLLSHAHQTSQSVSGDLRPTLGAFRCSRPADSDQAGPVACSGDRGLSEADTTVVGGHLSVGQHLEAVLGQQIDAG